MDKVGEVVYKVLNKDGRTLWFDDLEEAKEVAKEFSWKYAVTSISVKESSVTFRYYIEFSLIGLKG